MQRKEEEHSRRGGLLGPPLGHSVRKKQGEGWFGRPVEGESKSTLNMIQQVIKYKSQERPRSNVKIRIVPLTKTTVSRDGVCWMRTKDG